MDRLIDPFLTDDESTIHYECERVLNAAVAWRNGAMSWVDAARVGTLQFRGKCNPFYSRAVAMHRAIKDGDDRRHALMELVTFLSDQQGYVSTRHGYFSRDEFERSNEHVDDLLARGVIRRGIVYDNGR